MAGTIAIPVKVNDSVKYFTPSKLIDYLNSNTDDLNGSWVKAQVKMSDEGDVKSIAIVTSNDVTDAHVTAVKDTLSEFHDLDNILTIRTKRTYTNKSVHRTTVAKHLATLKKNKNYNKIASEMESSLKVLGVLS